MIRVKFTAKGHTQRHCDVFLRQFPGRQPVWGDCEFTFDPEDPHYDWLVAYDDLAPVSGERFSNRMERLACPAQHTIFITMEPSTIKTYGYDFLNQFGVILTSQEPWAIPHRQAVYTQPSLRWFYGAAESHFVDYDEIKRAVPTKSRDLSTVCSSKRQKQTMHRLRYDFTQQLKQALPEMDVFGRGVRPIDDKAEALDPYRYHVTIENHYGPHHWTEKLADAFLGATLPLYFGCPNADEYFPKESFVPIDIRNTDEAIQIVRETVRSGEYEKRLDAILHARQLVLDRYNLFAVLAREIQARHTDAVPTGSDLLYSRHRMRQKSLGHTLRFTADSIRTRWLLFKNARKAA